MSGKISGMWAERCKEFPAWTCPRCQRATVKVLKGDIETKETESSKRARGHEAWDPDWIDYRFAAFLTCSNESCGEMLVASGTAGLEHCYFHGINGLEEDYYEVYTIKAIHPAPPIFVVKGCIPEEVASHLRVVFELFWICPPAAINRLRVCLEDLLTHKRVKRYETRNGKRHALNLHQRILEFSKVNADAGSCLLALKWIGNSGSHSAGKSSIQRDNVLEAMEIFEHALDLIYDNKAKVIAKRAKKIILRKGF